MLHKAAHGTYNRGMAKGDGKSDKTDKPDKSGKGAKSEKTDKRIDKVLRLATNRIETIESSTTVAERLANAAKSSELLSAVWSLPPAQRADALFISPAVRNFLIGGLAFSLMLNLERFALGYQGFHIDAGNAFGFRDIAREARGNLGCDARAGIID